MLPSDFFELLYIAYDLLPLLSPCFYLFLICCIINIIRRLVVN